jgi:Family of unknown function (DUF6941)
MLGAGIDSLWFAEVPATAAIFLMLRVAGAEDEFEEETKLEVRVVDPEREETQALSLGFSVSEMPPLKQPGTEAGLLVPALIKWEAEHYGLYTLEVFLDDCRARAFQLASDSSRSLRNHQHPAAE